VIDIMTQHVRMQGSQISFQEVATLESNLISPLVTNIPSPLPKLPAELIGD